MPEIKYPVGSSSRIIAAVGAIETQRLDRLFKDPFAALLAGDEIIAEVIPTQDLRTDYVFPSLRRKEAISKSCFLLTSA
jgi:O-methyltransferase involved in polyketide biosynthesis